jgi:hypothetical protein
MKTVYTFFLITLFFVAQSHAQNKKEKFNINDYALFGQKFTPTNILAEKQMLKKYKSIKSGDSIQVTFESKIKQVCKKKGCWMKLDLGDKEESFVKFKDYAFFVPLNADNSDVIITGYAFVKEVPVAELKHYAKDAGKSKEEINKIRKPEITYSFMATGVYIKKT